MPKEKNNAGKPSTTPMPDHPISVLSGSSGPAPEQMPGSDSSSATSVHEETGVAVMAMPDYPAGRGGMRMVAPASPDESAEPATHPEAQIGPRPSATDMPGGS